MTDVERGDGLVDLIAELDRGSSVGDQGGGGQNWLSQFAVRVWHQD